MAQSGGDLEAPVAANLDSQQWTVVSFDDQSYTATPKLHIPRKIIWDDQVNWHEFAATLSQRVLTAAKTSVVDLNFAADQLATLAYDSNRLEGTAKMDGSSFALIRSFWRPDGVMSEDPKFAETEWEAEGGRDPSSPSSKRQWFQFCSAIQALLVDEDVLRGPLTVELLTRIHRIMMTGSTLKDAAGRIRTVAICSGARGAATHVFVDPTTVSPTLEKVIHEFNTGVRHPIQRATFLLYELLTIHPFENGNGRIARLFLCWSLMRDGFPYAVALSSGHRDARDHYMHAIYRARGQVYGARQTLAELNAITMVSLHRVLKNLDERRRLNAYVPVDDTSEID